MQNTSGNVQDAMEEVDNKGFTIKSQLWDPIILAELLQIKQAPNGRRFTAAARVVHFN